MLLRLILSYLQNRKMILRFRNCNSNSKDLTWGCPQGTLIGVILYILYINPIGFPGEITLQVNDIMKTYWAQSWQNSRPSPSEHFSSFHSKLHQVYGRCNHTGSCRSEVIFGNQAGQVSSSPMVGKEWETPSKQQYIVTIRDRNCQTNKWWDTKLLGYWLYLG